MKRKSRKDKLHDLLIDTYRELYANCTVPISFDLLMEISPKNEKGQILIPYEDYFISDTLYDEIVERNMRKMRMTKNEKCAFKFQAYLGCGPKTFLEQRENAEQKLTEDIKNNSNE